MDDMIQQKQDYTPTLPNLISELDLEALFADNAKVDALNGDLPEASKVFLIGMPSDIGVRAFDGRAGAERGPESFREMIQLCAMPSNPVSQEISLVGKIKIYDCGSIAVDQGRAIEHRNMLVEEAGPKLAELTSKILSKISRSRVIVIGGSDELNMHLISGLSQSSLYSQDGSGFSVLHFDPSIDVKPTHQRQIDEQEPT